MLLRDAARLKPAFTHRGGRVCSRVHVDARLQEITEREGVIIQDMVLRKLDEQAFKQTPRGPDRTCSTESNPQL